MSQAQRLSAVFVAFLKLGLVAFGGPVAHLGYLREEFVSKRHWLTDEAFGDLVALCQFLPGPASSQVVFALGTQRAGWVGGILASVAFMLPSAILMILFGYGVRTFGDLHHAGWLHGLKLVAVAVVAQAVLGMGRTLCPDRARLAIGVLAASVLLVVPSALAQLGVIAGGAMLGWWTYRSRIPPAEKSVELNWRSHLPAAMCLGVFWALLLLLPAIAAATGNEHIAIFDSFYRAGSLVFGGGHVVLPLLRAEVVPNGWIRDDLFLAGYGAAQAIPGPLFTFAAYLGAAMRPESGGWSMGLWCLFAIFLPAWLLVGGALPFWRQLRARTWVQAALRGANAAIVGVLLAALYNPVWVQGVRNVRDAAVAAVAFGLMRWWNVPSWAVVLLAAAAGQWLLK